MPPEEARPSEIVVPWLDNLDLLIHFPYPFPYSGNAIQHFIKNRQPKHQPHRVGDAREIVRQLEKELSGLKATLEVENEFGIEQQELAVLEGQVKEAVGEMDDIMDAWISLQAASWSSRYFFKKQLIRSRSLTIESEATSIMEHKLKPLVDKVQRELADKPQVSSFGSNHKARTRETVIGLEDELSTLIKYLKERSEEIQVMTVTGKRGIGKTTMASRIFHDERIIYEFPIRIWVYISEDLNMRDVLLTILEKFTREDMSSMSADDLLPIVSENLRLRKFLIVLDDVRTVRARELVSSIFPNEYRQGRVLLTTDDRQVAEYSSHGRKCHQLRSLTLEESWELLQLKIFGRTNVYPLELESVGRSIAASCCGLPLQIELIGGILFQKIHSAPEITTVKKEWEKMIEYTYPPIDEVSLEHIISLSYDALPIHLKDCFLYMGMFSADTEIPVRKLIQLWIAEGLVRQKLGNSLEETARGNLNELIWMNLLMVGKTNILDEVRTCRVHDIVRQFCRREGNEKQKLFGDIRMSNIEGTSPPADKHDYRRVSFHSCEKSFDWRKSLFANSRSFLCFSKRPIMLENKDVSRFTDAFSMVRVMDASNIVFPRFPVKLTEQFHMRYLTLYVDELKILPRCISELWNLLTLVVNTSSHTLECKTNIWNMRKLRHFMTKASVILKIQQSGAGGENLQTLTKLSPESLTDDFINKGKNMKKLGFRGALSDSMCFEEFDSVEKLTLQHDVHPSKDSENQIICTLPQPKNFPPKLRHLVLSSTRLDWEHMTSVVGKLVNLQALKLKNNAVSGDSWVVSDGSFIHLEALSIDESDLMFWTASRDSFGNLTTLELRNCPKLEEIPMELATNMEKLSLFHVGKYAVGCAKKIELKKGASAGKGLEIEGQGGFNIRIYPGDV